MKNLWSKATIIAGGFVFAMLIQIMTQCEDYLEYNGDDPVIEDINLDIKGMENGASEAETAFLSGDPEKVIERLSDDSKAAYAEQVQQIEPSVLMALGEAMKERELTVKSSTYAEFEFSEMGETYSIAFTLMDGGSWKLVRF